MNLIHTQTIDLILKTVFNVDTFYLMCIPLITQMGQN